MDKVLKKITSSLPLLMLLLLAVCLLLFPAVTAAGAKRGLEVCASSIIPALFPFFVVTNLWCSLGYAEKLGNKAAPVMEKIFHLPGAAASPFTLGLIGGYPVGAQTVVKQYEQGTLKKSQAERLLLFCNNAGPAFIFGIAGGRIFQSSLLGLVLYLIHAGSALLLGILLRGRKMNFPKCSQEHIERPSIATLVTDAIRQAGYTALQVCVFVIFFAVLSSYLSYFLPQAWMETTAVKLLLGTLELAGGAELMTELQNKAVSFCLISFLLGWGGLCVLFQTISILDKTDLTIKHYVFSKLLHGILSLLLSAILCPFLPLSSRNTVISFESLWLKVLPAFAILVLLVVIVKISSGKSARNGV